MKNKKLFDDPKTYCYDCSVMWCWKEKDGFHAIGSCFHPEPFKCDRKKKGGEKKMTEYPIIKLINGDEHYYCSLKDYSDYLLVEFKGIKSTMRVKIPKANILWWQI